MTEPVDVGRTVAPDPSWWRQAVVYQIYPRSFFDADDDSLGDLVGITRQASYLADLGVDAVWLSPFYPSALADGGYDVADYREVDPKLGTLEDFDAMRAALTEVGLKLIVDIVPNHSSDLHPWFQEALSCAKGSPARNRYIFREGRGEHGELPPSSWKSNFGGSAWERIPDGSWYLHLFAREQPDFNWDNPEIAEDFLTTLRFWSDRGVDGFRVDVANLLKKDLSEPLRESSFDESADKEWPGDGTDPLQDRDDVHEVYREWRKVFDSYDPPRAAVAEAWVAPSRRAAYASPDELGQAFNLDLLMAGWDVAQFRRIIEVNLAEAERSGGSSTWVFSNHDVIRHPSRYALPAGVDPNAWLSSNGAEPPEDRPTGLRRARAATMMMLALPGSAYLYQGEELGLFEVADLPAEVLQDPVWERTGHEIKGRDGCRVPLPWTPDRPAFGFSQTGAHLPQPEWFGELAVSLQDGDPTSTLELYRRALRVRSARQTAEQLSWLEGPSDSCLYFSRPGGWRCLTNFGTRSVSLPAGEILLSSGPVDHEELPGETTVWLAAMT